MMLAATGCGGSQSHGPKMGTYSVESVSPSVGIDDPDERSSIVHGDSEQDAGWLVEVQISGFESQQGSCRVAAYDSPSSFQDPSKAVARSVLPIEGTSMTWSFVWRPDGQVPNPAQLAISVHHDRDEDGKLDKSLVGIPTEAYGFSNNPKRGYGPPKFEQVAVSKPSEESSSTPWRFEITIQ